MSYQPGEPSERYPLPLPVPHPDRSRSPPGAGSGRDDTRAGFTRGGFAPIPHRHMDLPPGPPGRYEDDWDRSRPSGAGGREREREFPRRELDPEPDWDRRGDWDDYDRRPRGRPGPPPPHWEDDYDRPKRRRSPSPLPPSHRPRLHSPSPPRYPPSNYNLPDPASIETLLPFRHFAEWFRNSHPQTAKNDEEEVRKFREQLDAGLLSESAAKEKVGMAKRYERYRKEFTSRQLYALYLTHRDSIWFLERYSSSPEYIARRRRLNRQGRVPTAEKYLDGLRSGAYDSANFSMTETESGSTRRQNVNDEPEGLDRALGDKTDWAGDDAQRVEIAPHPKQIFVKTAPPTTSRKSLEELFASVPGFQWLALSEPSQKRSFHRVAWAQYADDVNLEEVIQKLDGSKIDGFTFHMSVNSTPTIGRVRVTPPVASTLERLSVDGEKAKALALKLEEELLGDDEEAEGDQDGEKKEQQDKYVQGLREKASDAVEEIISRVLSDEGLAEDELDDERKLKRAKIIADQWISYLRHGLSTCYYCVSPASFAEELQRKCIGHIRSHPTSVKPQNDENEIQPQPETEAEVAAEDEGEAEAEGDSKQAVVDTEERETRDQDQEDKPERRAAPVIVQGKKALFPQKTADEKWVENVDLKIKPLLEGVDVTEYGGRDPEEETRKLTAPMIKQEEPSKYRCKDCNKLFRAPEFVIKHIAVKHPEVTKTKLDEITLLNNFVLDPQHLQPGASTLAAVDDQLVGPLPLSLPGVNGNMNSSSMPIFNPAHLGNNQDANGGGGGFNMIQQQMMMMMQMQQAMMFASAGATSSSSSSLTNNIGNGNSGSGSSGGGLVNRIGGYQLPSKPIEATPMSMSEALIVPPPPPGGASEDPRARRGRVSYQDLDDVGSAGGGGLPY